LFTNQYLLVVVVTEPSSVTALVVELTAFGQRAQMPVPGGEGAASEKGAEARVRMAVRVVMAKRMVKDVGRRGLSSR
jgi:hypothetical protein